MYLVKDTKLDTYEFKTKGFVWKREKSGDFIRFMFFKNK